MSEPRPGLLRRAGQLPSPPPNKNAAREGGIFICRGFAAYTGAAAAGILYN